MVNPLRNVNSYYNIDYARRWVVGSSAPDTLDAYFGLGGCSPNSSGGMAVDDPPVVFPRIIFENAKNDTAVDYEALITAQSADVFYPLDEAAGDFLDVIGGLDASTAGIIQRQVDATGLGSDQLPSLGASLDGSSAYGSPPLDNIFGGAPHTAKTVALWIYPFGGGGPQILWEEGSLADGLSIYIEWPYVTASTWAAAGVGAAQVPTVRSGTPLRADVWQLVLVTFDYANQTMTIQNEAEYGNLVTNSTTFSFTTLPIHAGALGIGAANGSTRAEYNGHDFGAGQGLYYAGGLDNITYYNKVLTAAEIYALWWAGHAGVGAL